MSHHGRLGLDTRLGRSRLARRFLALAAFAALGLTLHAAPKPGAKPAPPPPQPSGVEAGLDFINTAFENASPLWYEVTPDRVIHIHLVYDRERRQPNRATGHFHFQLQGRPGATLTLQFETLLNVYNGRPGSVAPEFKAAVISADGVNWKSVPAVRLPDDRVQLTVQMPGPSLYVARIEPYRLSDLAKLLAGIRANPLVEITPIGRTVEGRPLEIVRVGRPEAPHRLFLRARAHPWESGGNWVVEGLIRRLLRDDAQAKRFLERYCVWILPMANKDGVARGMTRFNARGMDLNRNWYEPADPQLAPENAALEQWLAGMAASGRAPQLAIELHNDGSGRVHLSNYPRPGLKQYEEHTARLLALLRQHTWFTEGASITTNRGTGTLADGFIARYGIEAVVHELNCCWIAGLQDYPSARHWRDYGEQLATVFYEYFGAF